MVLVPSYLASYSGLEAERWGEPVFGNQAQSSPSNAKSKRVHAVKRREGSGMCTRTYRHAIDEESNALHKSDSSHHFLFSDKFPIVVDLIWEAFKSDKRARENKSE